jgi:hypothetical protein
VRQVFGGDIRSSETKEERMRSEEAGRKELILGNKRRNNSGEPELKEGSKMHEINIEHNFCSVKNEMRPP